jgi:hypothetical protein
MRILLFGVVLALMGCAAPQPEPSGIYTKPGVSPEQARAATLACDAVGKQKFPSKPSETYFTRVEAAQASYQCMTAQGYVRVK